MEFTAAMRSALEEQHCCYVLSVDTRMSLAGGMHYCGEIQDVILLEHHWQAAYFWPPCTHQTLSDTTSQPFKLLDGRTFWGIALYIFVLSKTKADFIMVEQPDTIIHDYYEPALHARVVRHRVRPTFFGDRFSKPINLTLVNASPISPPRTITRGADQMGFFDFKNAEERDRWRSDWRRFPLMVAWLARELKSLRSVQRCT